MAIGKTNAQRKILLTIPAAVTPTKSQQTITTPDGYDGIDQVVVDAIPNKYIDTTISKNAATKAQILSGQKAYVNGSLVTGSMPTIDSLSASISSANATTGTLKLNITPSVSGSIPGFSQDYGYISGGKTVSITDSNFIASNIKSGVSIFGSEPGTYAGSSVVSISGTRNYSYSGGYVYTFTFNNSNITSNFKNFIILADGSLNVSYAIGFKYINGTGYMYSGAGWGTVPLTVSFTTGKLVVTTTSFLMDTVLSGTWSGFCW